MHNENNDLKAMDIFVGQRLRSRRLELGLTLMVITKKTGISSHQMQKYEMGQRRLSLPVLYQLANLYGVKPQYFFEGFAKYIRHQPGGPEGKEHKGPILMAWPYKTPIKGIFMSTSQALPLEAGV